MIKPLIKDGDSERYNIFAECVCGHIIVRWQWHSWNEDDSIKDDEDVLYQTNYYSSTEKMPFLERIKLAYRVIIGNPHFLDDAQFTRKQVEYIKDGLIQALKDTKPNQETSKAN